MSELQVPDYRVRLFLSVDLTGSTAFKSKNKSSFDWLKAFQHFYGEFPKMYSKKFSVVCEEIGGIGERERSATPKIWKTIGDEILFVNRVYSINHLAAYITAFSKSLHAFGEQVQQFDGLNTKGNGWVASFPSPNCSIGIANEGTTDPISGLNELITEQFEASVDEAPEKYDFLGKGIDGGFRISRNSTINTFTISPALAYLLTKAKTNPDALKFEADFRFHDTETFKGVLDGKPYPIISIDTVRNDEERELHRLEANLLRKPSIVDDCEGLKSYLEKFIRLNSIEMPVLKLNDGLGEPAPPSHYQTYEKEWQAERQKSEAEQESFNQDGDANLDSEIPSVEASIGEMTSP